MSRFTKGLAMWMRTFTVKNWENCLRKSLSLKLEYFPRNFRLLNLTPNQENEKFVYSLGGKICLCSSSKRIALIIRLRCLIYSYK